MAVLGTAVHAVVGLHSDVYHRKALYSILYSGPERDLFIIIILRLIFFAGTSALRGPTYMCATIIRAFVNSVPAYTV